MNEKRYGNKFSRTKILTLGSVAFVAFFVLFVSVFEVSASLTIERIDFIGSNADLKINVTIKNTYTNDTAFNFTLKDKSNDDKEIIYSGQLHIEGNRTRSYIFGKYNYDYALNRYWENFRCGKHTIQAIIKIGGSTEDTETEDVDLSADNFDLTFSPDLETGKISPTTRVYMTVKGIDGKGINHARVVISDGDTKKEKTTDRYGKINFKISDLFSPPSIGTYTIKISKHEKVKNYYYCDYKKEFMVKKKLNISGLIPTNPKVNERITLTLDTDDYYSGIFLTIDGPKPQYYTLTDKVYNFVLDTPGTYKISVSKGSDYWTDERTVVVEENPELKIANFSEIELGKENEFVVLDANDMRVGNAKVTLSGAGISKMSDNNGIVKWTITEPGTYEMTAEKTGYKMGQKTFTVLKKLKMNFEPEKVCLYDDVKIMLRDESNFPVDGTITINNEVFPTRAGYINYNFTKFINYKIIGKAQNFADVEQNLKPLKILKIEINKKEGEEFSVGEDLNVILDGDGLTKGQMEIKNLDTNITITTATSKNYTYRLASPGNYEITATATGFGDKKKNFRVKYLAMELNTLFDEKNNKFLINVKSDGKGVENATIIVVTPKNLIGKLITDANGNAVFDAIYEEGNYTITAEKLHYSNVQQIVNVKARQDFGWILMIAIIIIVLLILAFLYSITKKKMAKAAS